MRKIILIGIYISVAYISANTLVWLFSDGYEHAYNVSFILHIFKNNLLEIKELYSNEPDGKHGTALLYQFIVIFYFSCLLGKLCMNMVGSKGWFKVHLPVSSFIATTFITILGLICSLLIVYCGNIVDKGYLGIGTIFGGLAFSFLCFFSIWVQFKEIE